MDLIIGSINTRGLGDRFKRREIFNCLKCNKKMSVYFIQEAHCIQENINDWRAEWSTKHYSAVVLVIRQV